ncbi:hypothetical protein [Actinocorallia aurantiaca]|uniref:Uncharacterized protein n=3 Tax=Actinocorallia TaxID=58108 RepID=A0ABN3US56_9ACTN
MQLVLYTWTPESIAAEPGLTEVFGTLMAAHDLNPTDVQMVELLAVQDEGTQQWTLFLRAHLPPDPDVTENGFPVAQYVDLFVSTGGA